MIAYVFWHRPGPGVDRVAYERAQATFHAALGARGIEGFSGSTSHRVGSLPWLAGQGWYEDWYLVRGSFALDHLNHGAVTGALAGPHEAAVHGVEAMAAALYSLRAGEPGDPPPSRADAAQWFAKPAGTTYAAFDASLAEHTARPGVALWRRMLVLGPSPEFCLHSPEGAGPDLGPVLVRTPIEGRAAGEDRGAR